MLTIEPEPPIPSGSEFQVQVDYFGTPGPEPSDAVPVRLGWFSAADGSQAFVASELDGAHSWFPANDHPLDKATFTFYVTVPDDLTAAANGTLVSVEAVYGGRATSVWEMTYPMATYLATVVIGEFDIVSDDDATAAAGVPIRHVFSRGTTVASWPGLERQGEMLAFLEGLLGLYPFDAYGIAVVDDFGTALENQTLSIFGPRMTSPTILEAGLVRELARQWFGNSVSTGLGRDIWLSEGFASYAEWLWIEHESDRATPESAIEAERAQFAAAALRTPGDPLSDDLFNLSVYRVGAMTLHALRLAVGDDVFFDIIRTYHERFRGGTATTQDFIAIAEESAAAGPASTVDLTELLDSWLFGDQLPEFG
jgi:aminopeptidase N